ncbi:MAG: hypothetical protein SGI98_01860 [Verrucomicrobiota bacterium]|nr:hypothetical protein [Verrucomicrobiota bacterium]
MKKIFLLVITLFTGLVLMGGCGFSRQAAINREYYMLDVVKFTNESATPKKAVFPSVVIMVQPLGMTVAYDKKSFVYRTGEYTYESDFYRSFQEAPVILIEEQTYQWIQTKKLFGQVIRPGTLVKPNFMIYGYVYQMYGDYSVPGDFKAVLSVGYKILGHSKNLYDNVVLEKIYTQKVPLKDRDIQTLIDSYNTALKNVLLQLTADIKKTDFVSYEQSTIPAGTIGTNSVPASLLPSHTSETADESLQQATGNK